MIDTIEASHRESAAAKITSAPYFARNISYFGRRAITPDFADTRDFKTFRFAN
jgi:hypothetical protein